MKERETPMPSALMGDCHFFNLRRAMHALTAIYNENMKDACITPQQFSILRHIYAGYPMSVTELSERIGLERTTMSRNLALLEHRGLLELQPSHGRQRQMALSAAGEQVYREACLCWEKAQAEVERRIGSERMELLESLLKELSDAE